MIKKLLEMFDSKNPLEIDEYDIINREQFYKLLLSVISITDDKSMQYSVNIRFVEGIINLQIWLSLVAKGRNYVLKKSKITSTKIYGDIEKVGDFIENN